MEHPHYDETLLVTCSQLLILVVPLKNHDIALMALQVLIHGEISTTLAFA